MTEYAEIAARLAAATPGPWWSAIDKLAHKRGRKPMNGVVGVGEGAEAKPLAVLSGLPAKQRHPDADFIAHAPSDIGFLLAEVATLRGACEEAIKWLYGAGPGASQRAADVLVRAIQPVATPTATAREGVASE